METSKHPTDLSVEETLSADTVPQTTVTVSREQLEMRAWMEGVLAQLDAQRNSGMTPRVRPVNRR